MKRIFLSALLGVGIVVAIFSSLSGSEAARTQQSYPLVCRGSANLDIGVARNEGNIGFLFTRGTKPASQGLAPGECSWEDRGMYPTEPDRLSQHVSNGLESLKSEGNTAPENRWYEELHSPDKYWTFMVYNDRQGQMIVTGARPNEEISSSPRPRPRLPIEIRKLDRPEKKPSVEPPVSTVTGTDDVTVATSASRPRGTVEVVPATIHDISPDSEFGNVPNHHEASGPVSTIVADPKNPNVLYAASWYAGVWKSTNGARTWKPANRGLATPFAQIVPRALAIDDQNSERLLFAGLPDDFRPFKPLGGLWFSPDAAAHWIHVDLPGCSVPYLLAVGFTGGVAFAQTGCGIFIARGDPADTTSWVKIPDPPGVEYFVLVGASSRLYTCGQDRKVKPTDKQTTTVAYRAIGSAGPWTFATSLPLGGCQDLAVAPDDPDDLIVALGDPLRVWRARVGSSFNGAIGEGFTFKGGGGQVSLYAVRRPHALSKGPGLGYDLFIADTWAFRQYEATEGMSGNWEHELSPTLHVDTHTMAFPPTYDPEKGNCTAWAATDGGVYATTTGAAGRRCDTWNSGWRHASQGLHIMASEDMAGVRSCGEGRNACPAIYLPTAHDDVWASLNGGSVWTRMDGIGDAAVAMVDPALPGQVLGARGGGGAAPYGDTYWHKYKAKAPSTSPSFATDYAGNLNSSGRRKFGYPPRVTFVQFMTLPSGDEVAPDGDYVALERPESSAGRRVGPSGGVLLPAPDVLDPLNRFDVIERNRTGLEDGWERLAVFERDAVAALAVSGGHKNPVFYVLTEAGDVYVLCSTPTPPPLCVFGAPKVSYGISKTDQSVWAFLPARSRGGPLGNLIVNPYDPQNLYATGSASIKSSTDGGRTWADEPELNEVATNAGEFRLSCNILSCSLAKMIFDRNHPNYRFALLSPGGVAFSRDSGKHWIAIQGPWSYGRSSGSGPGEMTLPFPYVLPISGFYDDTEVDPTRHTSSLYVALRGRGIVRVDAPFAKLGVGP